MTNDKYNVRIVPICWQTALLLAAVCVASTSAPDRASAVDPPPELPTAERPTTGGAIVADRAPMPDEIAFRRFLVRPAAGQYGRLPLHRDAVEAQLVAGTWHPPVVALTAQASSGSDGDWQTVDVNQDGVLDTQKFRGGYALVTYDSPAERVMLLEASGDAAVYVNGQPRAGDPYGLGWLRLPVLVRRGENTLLFHISGDELSAKLSTPPDEVFFSDDDHTLPTVVRGETGAVCAAVPVVNASRDWLNDLEVECHGDVGEALTTSIAPIPPLSVRKIGFQIPVPENGSGEEVRCHVRLAQLGIGGLLPAESLAETELRLRVVGPDDIHVRTFRSRIDGSVQPYAVRPAVGQGQTMASDKNRPGIIVALHGAGVGCEEFAARFSPKEWAHVVAPTGRRSYGFDWEDWGRIDALEVLADAGEHYDHDPRRTYLTGHSMGGHGTWHLGVTYPGLFAAIGPSGGWASFWSYGGGMPHFDDPDEIQALLLRGASPSDTLALLTNLGPVGVYILHGVNDEDVPAAQARYLRQRLADFHPNFVYFEQPDAGDWWGDETCDWPRMMEFFQHLSVPTDAERRSIDFATADPGVSDRLGWLSIEAQQSPLAVSHVVIQQDPEDRSFDGKTDNVLRLAIDVGHWAPDQPIQVSLDDQSLPRLAWPVDGTTLWFERLDDRWAATGQPPPQVKGPLRSGPFKAAFNNDVLLVYGTAGTPEENEWAEAKARYDAETFWYRGGGALDVLPDVRFDPRKEVDRNVILYGNARTNRAWPELLARCPVQVERGAVRVGGRGSNILSEVSESGDDLAVLFVYPRPNSDTALVGVVGGTGPVGMRLTNRIRYFISGTAYPDLLIFGPGVLEEGTSGIRAWGYFGPDWKVDSGEIAWQEVLDTPVRERD